MKQRTARIDWRQLGDLVCEVLEVVRLHAAAFEAQARARGITVEQQTAAAIVEAIRERIEGEQNRRTGP